MQESLSVCPFAVEAPAAGSNRCFLVFFSRESRRLCLGWNAKPQRARRARRGAAFLRRTPSMQRGHHGGFPGTSCIWGHTHKFQPNQHSKDSSPPYFFSPRKSSLSAPAEHSTFAQFNINQLAGHHELRLKTLPWQ